MHEQSIAVRLVEAVCEKAVELGARVAVVHVRLGPLSGVVRDALEFSFDAATAGTPIDGAVLQVKETPIRVRCPSCGGEPRVATLEQLRCPTCHADGEIVGGRELELFALEVSEDARH